MRPACHAKRKALQHRLGDAAAGLVAATAGVEEPALQQLYRVNATNFLMAVGSLIAVFALLSQIGDPGEFWRTISAANWWWLLLALVLSLATSVPSAVALMGTVPQPIPLWRTSELQLSMSFSNLAVPAVGGMAVGGAVPPEAGGRPRVRGRGRFRAFDRGEPLDVPPAVRGRRRAVAHVDPHRRDTRWRASCRCCLIALGGARARRAR